MNIEVEYTYTDDEDVEHTVTVEGDYQPERQHGYMDPPDPPEFDVENITDEQDQDVSDEVFELLTGTDRHWEKIFELATERYENRIDAAVGRMD